MSISIRQVDNQYVNNYNLPAQTLNFFGGSFQPIAAGDSIVVVVAHLQADPNFVSSITDNYGNTYVRIPDATVAYSAFGIQTWWCKSCVAVPSGPLTLTLTPDFLFSYPWVAVYDVTGISGLDVSGGTVTTVSTDPEPGPALDAGTGGLFISTIGIYEGQYATVEAPWSIPSGLANLGFLYTTAALIAGGVQQAEFVLQYSPDTTGISGVCFHPHVTPPPADLIGSWHHYELSRSQFREDRRR